MAEADRHIEEQIEAERKQAEEMAATRANKVLDFNRDYREGSFFNHVKILMVLIYAKINKST